MASINLSGILTRPSGEPDVGAIIKFTHATTTGNTVKNSYTELIIPPDGAYDIDVEYGQMRVDYESDYKQERFIALVVVNQDSTATSIPELLNASAPPTDEQLLEFQSILADTIIAKSEAESFAASSTFKQVNTFAELEALSPSEDGDFPKRFICVERANAEYLLQPSGYVAITGDVVFSNGRVASLVSNGRVNMRQVGVVADGYTDCSVISQNYIDDVQPSSAAGYSGGVTLYYPAGNYGFDNTVWVSGNGVSLVGDGISATRFVNNGVGSTFLFSAASPESGDLISRLSIDSIQFHFAGTNPSFGAHIKIDRGAEVTIKSCLLINHYRGVELRGCGESVRILDTDITQGSNTTTAQPGSCALAILRREVNSTATNGVIDVVDGLYYTECNSVYVDNTNFRSNNYGMEHCVYIDSVDGFYASNSHWGFATNSVLRCAVVQNNLGFTNLSCSGVFFDPLPGTTENGILYSGSHDDSIGSHRYTGCIIEGASGSGILVNCNVSRLSIVGCTVKNSGDSALNFAKGSDIRVMGNEIFNSNTDGGTSASILITDVDDIILSDNTIDTGYRGVQVSAASSYVAIGVNNIKGHSNGDIYLAAGVTNIKVSNDGFVKGSSATVASTSNLSLHAGIKTFTISGTATINSIQSTATSTSGTSTFNGREVFLRFLSVATVANGAGNLRLAGGFTAASGDCLHLICDGTNWFEVARSSNS